MYGYPVYLPEFSNREDFILTMGLFDDDTGDPLDTSYCTRAVAGDYTNNLWVVTDGPIVTMSQSVLTIPDYPIGNELSAVALVVDPNLNILPGDPISIASLPGGTAIVGPFGPPPTPLVGEDGTTFYVTEDSVTTSAPSPLIPGPNTMSGYVTSYAPATGALVCQIGCTFQAEIRRLRRDSGYDYGYGSSYDFWGTYNSDIVLKLSLGNGLMMVDTGILQIRVPELQARQLHHRTYGLGLTFTDSYDTRQAFIASLPMQSGGVSL